MHFMLTNSGCFLLSGVFSWSNWEQYLLGLIPWFSGRSSLLILPCTQHHLLWMKISVWRDWSWFILLVPWSLLFHIIVQYPQYSLPITICFINETFLLYFSRESQAKIRSRFFHLTYVEPKHQSDQCNQVGANDFQHLICIFWVCWLSPWWCNGDCSQLMSLFDGYQFQQVYWNVKHHPARNLQHKSSPSTFDTFDKSNVPSTFSKHCTSLCVSVVFSPLLT